MEGEFNEIEEYNLRAIQVTDYDLQKSTTFDFIQIGSVPEQPGEQETEKPGETKLDELECTEGLEESCPLKQGVCAGTTRICLDGKWLGCTPDVYSRLPFYKNPETCSDVQGDCSFCIDDRDNDCNGKVDEDGGINGELPPDPGCLKGPPL